MISSADEPRTQQVCIYRQYIYSINGTGVQQLCLGTLYMHNMYLQSAEALMLGMYPPVGSVTEVVELHTVDTKYDIINANPT